jgi:hypothetical protein
MKFTPRQKRYSPQRHQDTKIKKAQQPFTLLRHCEERVSGEFSVYEVGLTFEIDKRRGNLPSLNNNKELFLSDEKTTSPRTQSREIASWMQQQLAKLMFVALQTETRNDEEKQRVGYAFAQTSYSVLRTTADGVGSGIYYDVHRCGAHSAPYEDSMERHCSLRRTI